MPHAGTRSARQRVPGRLERWTAGIRAIAPGGWAGVGVGAVLLLTLMPGDRGLVRLISLLRDRAALRTEITRLEARTVALQEELRTLTSDSATLERLAREKLDLARRGEVVYKFPPAN